MVVEVRAAGVVFSVKAQAGSRKRGLIGVQAGALKVGVHQAPERGRANDAIVELLCEEIGCHRQQLTLLQGATSNQKKFLITGISADELRQRIAARLPE